MAGKHVLLEKPSTNSAEETQKLFDIAKSKGVVLLEAFHYRYDLYLFIILQTILNSKYMDFIAFIQLILDSKRSSIAASLEKSRALNQP